MSRLLGTDYRLAFAGALREASAVLDKMAHHPVRPPSMQVVNEKAMGIRRDIVRKALSIPLPRKWSPGALGYLHGIECLALLLVRAWHHESDPAAAKYLHVEGIQVYARGRRYARQIYQDLGAKVLYPTAHDILHELVPLMHPVELTMLHMAGAEEVQLLHTKD